MENKNEVKLFFNFILLLMIFIFVQCKSKSINSEVKIPKDDSISLDLNLTNFKEQEIKSILRDVVHLINNEELQNFPYEIYILNKFIKSKMYILPNLFENDIEYEKYSNSQNDTLNNVLNVDSFLIENYKMYDLNNYFEFLNKKNDNSILISISYPYVYKKYASIEVEVLISKDNGFQLFYLLEKSIDDTWKKTYKKYIIVY